MIPRCSILLVAASLLAAGCISRAPEEVVVYCALDKEFSEPILDQFESATGIRILPKFDVESNKTVGLANEIIQQAGRQRCDVFWNNEILHTLRLKKRGLLDVYVSPLADQYPPQFVSSAFDWYGFAARARVILVNVDRLPNREAWPTSIVDLVDDRWQGNCGMARPLFGTTATHAAVLYARWGNERASQFFQDVANNVVVESGNKQVAINVARGRYAWGLTDTDDAIIEIEAGHPVAIVFPDQGDDRDGALLIPNTICIVKGPHRDHARRLIDYLLQPAVEQQLARGASAQIALNRNSQQRSRVEPKNLKVMEVDFEKAAEAWDQVKNELRMIFPN